MTRLATAATTVGIQPRRAADETQCDDTAPGLAGLGLALPPVVLDQHDVESRLADLWGLPGEARARWTRIVRGSRIRTRYGVMPLEQVMALTTQDRMQAYERFAPALAARACRRALADAGVEPDRVTDLVVVSCTGFAAPGLDVALVEALGLAPTVGRTVVGFMGCFGAVVGLRTALGCCRGRDDRVALVVCLELCSLHLRPDHDPRNLVASALFGDGAAAAVVKSARGSVGGPVLGRIAPGHSRLLPEGRDWMTWRVTDAGFAMTLDRRVPAVLRSSVGEVVREAAPQLLLHHHHQQQGVAVPGGAAGGLANGAGFVAVHPGGPAILDAVERAVGAAAQPGLDAARDTLRRYGNMSSPTVLFVLAEAMRRGGVLPGVLLAFGPGLAIEAITIHPARGADDR